ncbi:hypothetical protein GCK72_003313 [Caenorhabditis remanei]|uniref:Nucleotide-diphospho-sugar transferase domain-containing protein n=1 Tax=Caenorhabditis remanei TaxID=31234 RepID=A0A6A5HX06_CAERE|nr:hypothetical protein GCK72_003313 [Caenorhabditis remanei]KAF1771486.1 hypothetical protein GCK72_003313 [Caenorhabditis remanei]
MRLHANSLVFLVVYVFLAVFLFVQFQKHTVFREEEDIHPFFRREPELEPTLNITEAPEASIPENCACKSTVTGNIYDFCYKLPENPKTIGKRFDCKYVDDWERVGNQFIFDLPYPDHAHFPESPSKFIDLHTEAAPEPVFVTAFNNPFFRNGERLISSIRKLGFHNKIVLYDLGISKEHLEVLRNKACNLEIRYFNFTNYSDYMKTLKSYRWKAIAIAEALRDFGAIWYLDSSVIFEKLNVSHVYDLVNCHNHVRDRPPMLSSSARDLREGRETHEDGWNREIWERNLKECRKGQYLMHGYSGHGILSVTNPAVYKYFPTNPSELKKQKAKMYDAGFVYAVNTRQTMMDVVKWYFLCALQEDCMAPKGADLGCMFDGDDRFINYAGCHRFDQSIINLVLANQFWYDRRYYVSEIVDFFHINRGGSSGDFEKDMGCLY